MGDNTEHKSYSHHETLPLPLSLFLCTTSKLPHPDFYTFHHQPPAMRLQTLQEDILRGDSRPASLTSFFRWPGASCEDGQARTRSQNRGPDETPTPGESTLTTKTRPATKKIRRAMTQAPIFPALGRHRQGAGLEMIPEDEDDEIDIYGVPTTAPSAEERNVRHLFSEINRYSNRQKSARVKKRDNSVDAS
ncbi:hypothetical protein BKA56DRAFT_611620 [Ilyonectria sp. MPI-CAGE-AT-0026]|nr:hypothetical protein BKA56DRAFT_611620 [Ilyonectria sp. MPI-CAGE-AT-0026]